MVISKEVLNAMRMCGRLTIVKRSDGKVYMICSDIEIKNLDVKIEKEFETDSDTSYNKIYATYYPHTENNIGTCLSFLKPGDNIMFRVSNCKLDQDTTLVEIHLLISRLSTGVGPSKHFDFLLSVTTPKYL